MAQDTTLVAGTRRGLLALPIALVALVMAASGWDTGGTGPSAFGLLILLGLLLGVPGYALFGLFGAREQARYRFGVACGILGSLATLGLVGLVLLLLA